MELNIGQLDKDAMDMLIDVPVDKLKITKRTVEVLNEHNIVTLRDILDSSRDSINEIKGFSRQPARMIDAAIKLYIEDYLRKQEKDKS